MTIVIKNRRLFLSLVLLYYYGKLIGLCPFILDSKEIFKYSRCGVLYSVILSFTYFCIFFSAMIRRFKVTIPNKTIIYDINDSVVVTLQFCMIIVSWLVFAFRQRRIQKIVKDIKKTGEVAKELGIVDPKDRWEILRILRFYGIFLNVCYFGQYSTTLILYNSFPGYDVKMWAPFFLPHVVFHNVLVLFVIALQIMQWRFHRLNLHLRNLPSRKQLIDIFIPRNSEIRCSNQVSTSIENLRKLHSLYRNLTEDIVDFFSLPILMALITGFLQTVLNVFAIYLYNKKFETWGAREILVNANLLIWFLIVVTEMFFLSSVSGSTCEEANNTGNILHRMRLDYKLLGCENVIRKVSVQLLQKRLNISLYGFINLNFQFIYSFCGTITTYLIIMLQFDSSQLKEKYHH